eukprot:1262736-Amphidinium_carterae.2
MYVLLATKLGVWPGETPSDSQPKLAPRSTEELERKPMQDALNYRSAPRHRCASRSCGSCAHPPGGVQSSCRTLWHHHCAP